MRLVPLLLLLAGAVHAAPAIEAGARLAATCAACHGTVGASQGTALPALAGQPRDALAASLRAFRDGRRPGTVMQQIAKGYSDEQIAQVSAYLAAQKSGGRP